MYPFYVPTVKTKLQSEGNQRSVEFVSVCNYKYLSFSSKKATFLIGFVQQPKSTRRHDLRQKAYDEVDCWGCPKVTLHFDGGGGD